MRTLAKDARSAAALVLLALAACGGAEPRSPARDAAAPALVTLASAPGPGPDRLRAGDLAGARAAFEADLGRNPDGLGALNDLAVSYLLQGHSDAASRLLDEVVAKGNLGDQQAALVNLGELYATQGYVSAAQAYLDTASSLDPSRPEPWYALAVLADARGELERARAALREALARDDGGAARSALAYLYPEERVHLEALVAEQAGDGATAADRWRALAAGRFPALAAAAERHLAGE
ncbi:MAG TPA: tetratricopeptide repeat protein [Anaeromyxobacter sp.]